MDQFSNIDGCQILVVCPEGRRERLERELLESVEPVRWLGNVFEATAEAVELTRWEGRAVICVLVDYLAGEEMRVFDTLAGLDGLKVIAISLVDRPEHGKIRRAKLSGADRHWVLGASAHPLAEVIDTFAQAEVSEETAGDGLGQAEAAVSGVELPLPQPPDPASAEPEPESTDEATVLSDAELAALLGPDFAEDLS